MARAGPDRVAACRLWSAAALVPFLQVIQQRLLGMSGVLRKVPEQPAPHF
jgi:hypothetical protein